MRTSACIMLCLTLAGPLSAATKKPITKQKPKSKTSSTIYVKGTAQLPGDNGVINQAYTMGKDNQLNFNLLSAEYTAGRLNIGTTTYYPGENDKAILLRFAVQNPNPKETLMRFDSFMVTAIDSKSTNYDWCRNILKQGDKESYSVELKPGQKVELLSFIVVPKDANIPKFMVSHYSGGKVLRYDTKPFLKAVPAPYNDPEDKTGSVMLSNVPGKPDIYYPQHNFDLKFVSGKYVSEKIGDREPGENKRFFVATITFKNAVNGEQLYRFDTFHGKVTTPGNDSYESIQDLLKGGRDESAEAQLAPGGEYTGRMLFEIGKDEQIKTVTLWENDSRKISFDISNVK